MSAYRSRLRVIAASVLWLSCGDDAGSDGDDPGTGNSPEAGSVDARKDDAGRNDREDAATAARDAVSPMGEPDASADASVASSERDATTSSGDAALDASARDAMTGIADAAVDASRGRPDPAMVTTGPSSASGTFEVHNMLTLNFVDGFAYFDPTSNLTDGSAMKIVLTTWKVDACDPEAVWREEAQEGRGYLYCVVSALDLSHVSPASTYKGRSLSWSPEGRVGCWVYLTKGALEGGSQIEGTMGISPEWGGPALSEVSFRLNHCGTVDPVNANI